MLPPPPPPLPPMRAPQRAKIVHSVSSTSSNLFDSHEHIVLEQVLHSHTLTTHEGAKKIDRPFQPCHMFFYGSLMDAKVIQAILALCETPKTSPATLSGFKIKMWGIYPALIPSDPSDQVVGCTWKVDNENHFKRLAAYETAVYTWVECEAHLDNEVILKDCRTFCWAGSPDSKELEEGNFDLERYQKYFKSSVVRRK